MVAKRPREKNSRKLSTVNSAASAPGFFSLVSIMTVFREEDELGISAQHSSWAKRVQITKFVTNFFFHANMNLGGHRNLFRKLSTVNSAASASCFFSLVCILTFFCREIDELGISSASWAKRVQITTFAINFFIMQIRIKVDTEALTDMSVFRLVLPYSGPNKRNKNEIKIMLFHRFPLFWCVPQLRGELLKSK